MGNQTPQVRPRPLQPGYNALSFIVKHASWASEPTVKELFLNALKTAHFLRIQTSHVTGPASSSVIGRPAILRASLIWP